MFVPTPPRASLSGPSDADLRTGGQRIDGSLLRSAAAAVFRDEPTPILFCSPIVIGANRKKGENARDGGLGGEGSWQMSDALLLSSVLLSAG